MTAYEMCVGDWSSDVCSSYLDADGIALALQPQDCRHEIRTVGAVYPTGAQNGMLGTGLAYGLFARQLGTAIDSLRVDRVVFAVQTRFGAIEDVVGGIVNQQSVDLRRLGSQSPWSLTNDAHGQVGILPRDRKSNRL